MHRSNFKAFLLGASICLTPFTSRAVVTFDWATVGDEGNAADPLNSGSVPGIGSVAYTYLISKHEVTNAQYVEFLNAKATLRDPLSTSNDLLRLYNPSMSSNGNGGGIDRTGTGTVGDPFVYSVQSGKGNFPVTWVSWYDATRMANWMHNGQGSGDTETGAYTLGTLGANAIPTAGSSITRNPGSTFFIPTESEWYKAAYHQPSIDGGDSDNYWLYPTGTNTEPNSDQPPGDASIIQNVGNFFRDDSLANGFNDGYAVTGSTSYSVSQNYLTDVGAYTSADSFYGTFDQGGNVWEWNETLVFGSSPVLRGGSWINNSVGLRSDFRNYAVVPTVEDVNIGFRLASIPEPSSIVVGLGLALQRYVTPVDEDSRERLAARLRRW